MQRNTSQKNNETRCIICGNRNTADTKEPDKDLGNSDQQNHKDSIEVKIGIRLAELVGKIGTDVNLPEEEQRLRVIYYYVKLLEKANILTEKLRQSNLGKK